MIKEFLKKILKGTHFYYRYKYAKQYKKATGTNIFHAFFITNVIDDNDSKEKQIRQLFERVEINNIGYGKFFYSIDNTLGIHNNERLIDNIPVDYDKVVNQSWDLLKKENPELMDVIYAYAERCGLKFDTSKPAQTLEEALQRILFWNQMLWQTGHYHNGLGMLDRILDRFPISIDSEELVSDFIKTLHSNYKFKSVEMVGDTGQIITLGGLYNSNNYFCNEYTYLFITAINKLHFPDPKILLRVSYKMPDDILTEAFSSIASGIGSPVLSNDDVIVDKLIEYGYESDDVYSYGSSACWETLIIGKSADQNNLENINYALALNKTIRDERFTNCSDLDKVFSLFSEKLNEEIDHCITELDSVKWSQDPLLKVLLNCGNKKSPVGAKYNNFGLLSVGISSTVNSLLNINRLVFVNNKYSLDDVQTIINNNYYGYEELRNELTKNGKFGTEDDDAVKITNKIIKITEEKLKNYKNCFEGRVKFGLSSYAYLKKGKITGTTFDGRKSDTPFATHISNDYVSSPTEIINFASKLKISGLSCNANVIDVMFSPSLIDNNKDKFVQFIKGAIISGFFQMQINVVSYAQLVDAKSHPEDYPNLIVRVWGFSAYFNDIPNEYKDLLINRAKEMEHIA